ncbi:hypothetical protein A8C56_21200 [Niabella ginsenosidivorans]|uniref:Uncharacterized protein n=1 Tax=Niabella ginsenosidivorans TaxID=1176587 RepID=A0A1A9I8Z2_9BACT|nr:hypothetical protein [Niabella ginsenosidivorans]ANH83162.1 hypothetical protein A8C56_21200 [Niabella ginsenosidivorans]
MGRQTWTICLSCISIIRRSLFRTYNCSVATTLFFNQRKTQTEKAASGNRTIDDRFTFKERIGCFGVSEIKGTFRVIKDTIYFDNVQLGRPEDHFYKFAVIKAVKSDNSKILGDLIRYKDITDTVGHELWIIKNELQKLNDKNLAANREDVALLADK